MVRLLDKQLLGAPAFLFRCSRLGQPKAIQMLAAVILARNGADASSERETGLAQVFDAEHPFFEEWTLRRLCALMRVHPVHKAPDVDATTRAFLDLAMVVDWNERDDAAAAVPAFAMILYVRSDWLATWLRGELCETERSLARLMEAPTTLHRCAKQLADVAGHLFPGLVDGNGRNKPRAAATTEQKVNNIFDLWGLRSPALFPLASESVRFCKFV